MEKSKLKVVLISFSIIAVLLTVIPFIAVDYWWIRMFDFPHFQLTLLTAFAIAVYFIKFNFKSYKDYLLIILLILCLAYQSIKLYPYTKFADYQVKPSSSQAKNIIKVFTANLLQDNNNYSGFIDEVNAVDADVMLLTEANNEWQREISKEFSGKYQYKVEYPLDNTYGMLLLSRYQLLDSKIKFLVSDSIPSIHSRIKINDTLSIQLHCVHPTPPMPQENPKSTDRDSELMQIAIMCKERDIPVIVLGDFNDVAWSQTSKLFHNVSELLDVRIGRGLYNTYSAQSWIFRWPLDHLFVSEEFRVKSLKNGSNISSDHFPFYAELTFEPQKAGEQKPLQASEEEIALAKKQIEKEANKNSQ